MFPSLEMIKWKFLSKSWQSSLITPNMLIINQKWSLMVSSRRSLNDVFLRVCYFKILTHRNLWIRAKLKLWSNFNLFQCTFSVQILSRTLDRNWICDDHSAWYWTHTNPFSWPKNEVKSRPQPFHCFNQCRTRSDQTSNDSEFQWRQIQSTLIIDYNL